ncbi:hypothetical protein GCM10011571_09330 [Marinithermofilum abyssi]|uniref:Uncharacterized protein n=1 Tax=Marinithermofilum abyssi TaxID=1571185 RepID=A0A8J2VGW4_9BACL|nr:protease complex subunit PrcB family protein [Marinithermofilum abyssi]GGE10158.1 hypothetical protein GCM10011571_09330 [Marinithermofilum abyssi]
MGKEQSRGSVVQCLSSKEEKALPGAIRKWVAEKKQERGVHLLEHEDTQWVLVAAGIKPNPGHQLIYEGEENREDHCYVKVSEIKPEPGRMYPQIIVYPYLLLKKKDSGKTLKVRTVERKPLFDEDGNKD